jgi:glycosyltransferase involved in cell wall biosynthesis
MTRRALVLSPTPSHPADHGHRNRVRQTTGLLARAGYAIDFVLYPIDDDWQTAVPPGLEAMQASWGRRGGLVTVVPPGRVLHAPPAGVHHELDEWWDPAIDSHLQFLWARRRYQVMLVNYVFLSRAFLHATGPCRRVLDTHDRLSGRRELFERHGAEPEFFFTTEAEEARGLARADIVLAIKPSEAAAFAVLTDRKVVRLPFASPRPSGGGGATRRRGGALGAPLRVGFLGADNAVNAINLRHFLERLERWCGLYLPDLTVLIAGNVCRRIAPAAGFVTLLGHVEDPATFYAAVDVVVAPLMFSTGLKIKVAEALGRGVPVVATADAFDGFTPADPFHTLADIEAVCAALMALAADRGRLAALGKASARALAALRKATARGAATLLGLLARPGPVLHVVTDIDYAARSTLAEERVWQAVQYFSALVEVRVTPPGVALLHGAAPLAGRWHDCREMPPLEGPPPLRHLPLLLDGAGGWAAGAAGAGSVIVVVETGDGEAAWAAREALLAAMERACGGERLDVIRAVDLPHDAAFLADLAAVPRPRAIVALDPGAEARDLLACLASLVEAAFFCVGDPYPLMPEGAEPRLVRNVGEHIDAVAQWLWEAAPLRASAATSDAGWSVLWAQVAARARA